jgi:phosphoglycolate phosphatase-like HAD superfamily hydrolase
VPFFSTFVFADRVYTDTDRVFAPMRQLLPALHAADYRLALVTNNYFLDTPRTRSALYIQPYVQYFDAVCVGARRAHTERRWSSHVVWA